MLLFCSPAVYDAQSKLNKVLDYVSSEMEEFLEDCNWIEGLSAFLLKWSKQDMGGAIAEAMEPKDIEVHVHTVDPSIEVHVHTVDPSIEVHVHTVDPSIEVHLHTVDPSIEVHLHTVDPSIEVHVHTVDPSIEVHVHVLYIHRCTYTYIAC